MKLRRIPGFFIRYASTMAQDFLNRSQRYKALTEYWERPDDRMNLPERYSDPELESRSEFLVRLADEFDIPKDRVLEIGCNVGRNLDVLRRHGFTDLHGIELSQRALEALVETYPDLTATLHHGLIEEIVPQMGDKQFNLVFSMAVLQHIHPEMEWIFRDIARVTGHSLITVEGEFLRGYRSFPRNYRLIFEKYGLRQVASRPAEGHEISHYTTRVFLKDLDPE